MSQDRLEASLDIDRRSTLEIVRIIQEQDCLVADAVAAEAERIAQAIDRLAERLASGGHLFYAGAGTSGRIAMLDAAELPPTFGVEPSLVRVLMGGGERAFLGAAEGAEDDEGSAIAEVDRQVTAGDAVVGIAASGTTPYTVAAVRRAKELGAFTVGGHELRRTGTHSGFPPAARKKDASFRAQGHMLLIVSTTCEPGGHVAPAYTPGRIPDGQ